MLDGRARELLERPGLLGVVCTRPADDSPQANPVWFRFDGERIQVWTDEERRWVINLRRDPRVAFSVHENERPWRSLTIRGRGALGGRGSAGIDQEIRAISARYLAQDEIEAYLESWPATRSVVSIEPLSMFMAQAFEDPIAGRRD